MKKRSLGAEGRDPPAGGEQEHSSGPKERPNGATTTGEGAAAEPGGPPESGRAGAGLQSGTGGAGRKLPGLPEYQRGRWPRYFWPAGFLALNAVGIALIIWRVEASARPSAELYTVRTYPETKATPEGLAHAVSPEGTTEVVVEFGSPLDPASVDDGSLQLLPIVKGKTNLVDWRKLVLRLAEPLRKATRYRVVVSDKLRGIHGELPPDGPLYFETPPLAVLGVSQAKIEQRHSTILAVDFNGSVNPLELIEHLSLRYPDGSSVSGEPVGGRPARTVRIRMPLARWDRVKIEISEGLSGTEGPLPLRRTYRTTARVASRLAFLGMNACWRGGRSVIEVKTNSPINATAAGPFVGIEPHVRHTFDASYRGLTIVGSFEPGRRYRVTLKAGLPGGSAGTLEKDITRVVWAGDRPVACRFALGGGYLSPHGLLKVPVRSVNTKGAKVSCQRLYETNIVEYALRSDGSTPWGLGTDLPTTVIGFQDKPNEEVETLLDLRNLLGDGAKGVHCLTLEPHGDKRRWRRPQTVVVITDLGLSVRLSGTPRPGSRTGPSPTPGDARRSYLRPRGGAAEALVWVTSISTSKPVAAADVAVYSDRRQLLGSGITGPDGIAEIELRDTPRGERTALVVVRKGDDQSYIALSRNARSRGQDSARGRAYLARGYEAFLMSERGVYRPGDTVRLSGFVRGREWETPPAMPLELVVHRPDGRRFVTKVVTTDEAGRLLHDLAVPREARSGRYRVMCRLPGGKENLGESGFRVADYVPRTLRMRLEAPDGPLPARKPFNVSAHVEQLFGDAARGLKVRCRAKYSAEDFRPRGFQGYVFGDRRKSWGGSRVDLPRTKLDESGNATFTLRAPGVPTPAGIRARIEVEVQEPGGRALAESLSRRLDAWDFYVGVRPPEEKIEPGTRAAFLVAAVAPAGTFDKLSAGVLSRSKGAGETCDSARRFRASLYRVSYSNVLRRLSGGRLRYEWTRHEKLVSSDEGGFRRGRSRAALTVEFPGSYRLVVTSAGGCPVTHDFYVSGPGARWAMDDPEALMLTLDRRRYRPGASARLSIRAPFGGTALVCVETDRVLERRLVELPGGEGTVEFTVDEGWRPNVYLTATLIRPVEAEEEWRPHRASGAVRIEVDCADRKLGVEIASPRREGLTTARPGRELVLDVKVTSVGAPVRVASGRPELDSRRAPAPGAAVVLAAVDEGVLALTGYRTPDPFDFFYSMRRLGVREFDMYSRLAPELAAWRVEKSPEPGGGGRGPGGTVNAELARRLNPIEAKRVKSAVLYAGMLITDERGVARATFTVPEYVGELRVMAFAAAGVSLGSAEKALPVKSPIMARASWPRFLAPGDEFELPVTVFNRTSGGGAVELRLDSDGPLDVRGALPVTVNVAAGAEETAYIPLRGTGIGKAEVRLTARLGDEDYTESVEIPVRPPVAFARRAGSVLVEAGSEKRLTVGGEFLPGTAKCSVVIAGSPAVELAGALRYLLSYPYGCAEQTTSRLLPLVYLRDLAELAAPDLVGPEEIDAFLEAGFLRLRMMQTYSGGLSTWPGGRDPYPWASCYAAGFLVEAGKAGCDAPKDLLEPLLEFLARRLEGWATARDEHGHPTMFGEAAYAACVLARAGKTPHTWLARLEEIARECDKRRKHLPVSGRFHLAAAFLAAGELDAAKKLIADSRPACTERERGRYLSSPVREAAVMLSVLLDVNPESEQVRALADRLRRSLRLGRWGTTQENAFALMALGKYARRLGPPPEGAVIVTMPDGTVRKFGAKEGLLIRDVSPGQSLAVKFDGKGRIHAFWHAEGVPRDGEAVEEDSGLSIRRRFLRTDARTEVDPRSLKQGEIYLIELEIRADRTVENLVITDLLPAGLEIENPELKGSASLGVGGGRSLSAALVERRDDRILVFGCSGSGRRAYRYAVRAVTPGRFVLPAAEASCMYDPGLYSVHGKAHVEVKR